MYVQVCIRPDISFVVVVLGRYLSNPSMQHWKAVNHVMCYLKRIKGHMLSYQKSNSLEIIGYSNSDYLDMKTANTQHLDISVCWPEDLSLGSRLNKLS